MEFRSVTLSVTLNQNSDRTISYLKWRVMHAAKAFSPHTLHVLQTCVILSLPVPSQPKFGYHNMQKTAAKETVFSLPGSFGPFRSLDRRMSPVNIAL